MDKRTTRQCVIDFTEALFAGDVATLLDCCDDDLTTITYAPVELFPHLGHKQGKAWVPEAIRIQEERYKNRRYKMEIMTVDGENAATMLCALLEKRSDGRMIQLQIANFFTVRAGRIVAHRSFFDSFDLVQQLLGQDLTEAFAASVKGAMRNR
jgi:uncharacterized protein